MLWIFILIFDILATVLATFPKIWLFFQSSGHWFKPTFFPANLIHADKYKSQSFSVNCEALKVPAFLANIRS